MDLFTDFICTGIALYNLYRVRQLPDYDPAIDPDAAIKPEPEKLAA